MKLACVFVVSTVCGVTLGIQSPENGFMEPKGPMRFGGDWTPQSSAENMTGCLGSRKL